MSNDIFYFGCMREAGHYLYHPSGGTAYGYSVPNDFPCTQIPDAVFLPKQLPQDEGVASFLHLNGWTIIAFWDRSVDSRPGSNSVFLARGIMSFEAICAKSREAFPAVWKRFKFPVVERK